ncbi:InlB B-repeat-containing protein [Lysinibacillus sp. FSL H8-0500]|uniref:InlB B-repeat-containing protein n=1 Tax=Lysinibacillus sp. FSL H8-0500 TaxID=2921393 RepID=UPI003101996E
MQNNVAIYGGFNGTETELTARNWEQYPTILSGDIDNTPTNNTGNSYHVFYHPDGLQLNSTAILDGVTITGGNANDGGYGDFRLSKYGGGMYNGNSSPTLTNVTMSGNETKLANKGAICGGSPKIYNSLIAGNNGEPALHSSVSATIENSLLDVAESGNILAKFHQSTTDIQNVTYIPEAIFIDPSQRDYQLRAGSPAINKGNNTRNTELNDLLGNPRKQGTFIDLGAYESEFAYQVDYDVNGATGGILVDKMTYKQGDTVTVQNNSGILERTGHTFVGWNTQADGTGDDYAENASFTMGTQNQTFYAQWTPNRYAVTFESNGGSDVAEQQVLYNEKAIAPPVPSRQGHTFAGWYTDGNDKWDFVIDAVTKDITLYAQWTENPTYKVTYDSNGATDGDIPEDTQRYEENTSVTVQGNSGNLARTGYTFVGWNIQADGKGTSYQANDTFQITANIKLYAKWIPNIYKVIFESNGGSAVAEQQVPYNEKAIAPPVPSRQGYIFAGWYTDENEKWDFAVDVVTKDIPLYAQWKVISNPPPTDGGSNPPPISNNNDAPPAKVTITLHTNGGTAIAPIDIAYNTKISDLPIPTREGYRFAGWYQDEELTKPWAADTVLRENISLYAKWTALPVEEPQPQPEPEAPSPTVTFSDIQRHWAKEMIEELTAQGIIQGFEDGTFRPNESISRMHVAALLTRAFSFEQVRAGDDFKDVSPTHSYYEAIMTLQQAGIVDGTNGAFLPNEKMTRAQLAKVLVGLMGRTPEGTSSFTDVASTHWSAGYIAVLEQEGIALGDNDKFNPNVPVTRAQFVTFLYRILQNQ